jgi:hypothetical protein
MLNGKIDIRVINGRIRCETSLDPVLVALICEKVSIRVLEEQVSAKSPLLNIKELGLIM